MTHYDPEAEAAYKLETKIITHLTEDELIEEYGYEIYEMAEQLRKHHQLQEDEELVLLLSSPSLAEKKEMEADDKITINVSSGRYVCIVKKEDLQ